MDSAAEIGARAFHQAFFVLPSDSEAEVFALSEQQSSCGAVFTSLVWGLGRPELASGHGAFSPSAGLVKKE